MPSLRSQAKLDFPIQKTRRSRTSLKAVEEDTQSPRKRRTQQVSENEPVFECSPTKKTKTQRQARDSTPSKKNTPAKTPKSVTFDTTVRSRRSTIGQSENQPPVPELTILSYSQSKANSLPSPLSPRKNIGNIPENISPLKSLGVTPKKSPLQQMSPARYANSGLPSVRVLDFSPSRGGTSSQLALTPPKSITIQKYTPTKRGLTFSPAKEMRLGGSPARKNILGTMSPRRAGSQGLMTSPRKMINQAILESPRKTNGLLASPRKMGSNGLLASPRKEMPPLSPRKLDVRSLTSPMRLAKQEGICYQRAKQALHTALPDRIVCRDKERNTVQGFLDSHVKKGLPGSLYISGAPGTGKTAVMSHIIQDLQNRDDCQSIYINCMNSKNSQAIFNKVQSELFRREITMPTKQAVRQLEKVLSSKGEPIVLILDEVDQLDSRNQDVLYTMFEWPSLTNSRLVLIGIANALDLTDRILPRLQARPNCRPELLNFEPYTKDQIVAVLKDRLNQDSADVSLEGHVVLDPSAVQFCARKVAAVAGDMRRALDVCRRAVEMVEADVRKQPIIHPISSLATGCASPSKRPPVPKKITVAHIMKTLNEVYGSSVTSSSSAPQTIPLQQKLAICSLLLMVKYGKAKEVTLGKLHETYKKVCSKQQVGSISQSEFHSLCSLIEAKGILSMKKAKEARTAKVTLKLDESELEAALQDKVLVSTILQNGLPK